VTARLAVVVSGFPRTSETFAIGELVALMRAGMLQRVYATKPGDGATPQPGVEKVLPLLRVLPVGGAAQQAEALAEDLGDARVDGLHGYFAHRPAEVAAAAAAKLGVGFSFSVHALDARKVAAHELAGRARAASGVVACNADVAQHVAVPGARVRLLPHGVDLDRFTPGPPAESREAVRVLAVGRLVEKKGLSTLVDAVARLEVPWVLRIVGTGDEHARLQEAVDGHGLTDKAELAGRRSHDELPDDYAWADVVTVPSVVDRSGDRDGLPNVALEAMASGRPLVVSDVAVLGAAVREAGSGLVVPPGDAAALADALTRLAAPGARAEPGIAGRRYVEESFDLAACTRRFVEYLNLLHARAPEAVDA
jgi:glycosyltransferase involved in cell wall biosynthesis